MKGRIFYVWDDGESRDGPYNWRSWPDTPPYFADNKHESRIRKLKKVIDFDEYQSLKNENELLWSVIGKIDDLKGYVENIRNRIRQEAMDSN